MTDALCQNILRVLLPKCACDRVRAPECTAKRAKYVLRRVSIDKPSLVGDEHSRARYVPGCRVIGPGDGTRDPYENVVLTLTGQAPAPQSDRLKINTKNEKKKTKTFLYIARVTDEQP